MQQSSLLPTIEHGRFYACRVELFTDTFHVDGEVRVRRWRLADALNDESDPFLLVEQATTLPLAMVGQEGGYRHARYAQISKHSIVFAIPHESEEMEAARQQYLNTLYRERARAHAIVTVPPFEITGILHLRKMYSIRQALEDLRAEFIPLTEAIATYLPDPRIQIHANVAIVNRPRAQIFCLTKTGEEERTFMTE